jgi:hypothetical protein
MIEEAENNIANDAFLPSPDISPIIEMKAPQEHSPTTESLPVSAETELVEVAAGTDTEEPPQIKTVPVPPDPQSASEPESVQVPVLSETQKTVKIVGLEAAGRSSIILYCWNLLGNILDRHEDSLRKR